MGRSERDDALVAGLRFGEPAAVDALVARYGARVYRAAIRLLHDSRDAEEVTQDVLLTVARKIGMFRHDAAFSTWLYRIALNMACRKLQARRSRPQVPLGSALEAVSDESQAPGDPAVATEARAALEHGLARLPGVDRIVLTLCHIEGWTHQEVAAQLRISPSAVKSRAHRARALVRRALADLPALAQ